MKTIRDTTWAADTGGYETLPAGTDVRTIDERDIDSIAGHAEGRAVRGCAARMRAGGEQVVFGVVGNVRCFVIRDFK